jgi:hypothetical protein
MTTVSIAKDFSPTPGGRFTRDGPYSGEAFRKRLLEPYIDRGDVVLVELDDVAGLPSSFLEEAFGGLFRRPNATQGIRSQIQLSAQSAALTPYISLITRYMDDASRRIPG